jgi:hypothetical protein
MNFQNVPIYFISPVGDTLLAYSDIVAEWYQRLWLTPSLFFDCVQFNNVVCDTEVMQATTRQSLPSRTSFLSWRTHQIWENQTLCQYLRWKVCVPFYSSFSSLPIRENNFKSQINCQSNDIESEINKNIQFIPLCG